MSKQNSRTRRKIAAGFQGVGSYTDFNSKQDYGTLDDKAKIVAVSELYYATRNKAVCAEADRLGLYKGKHTGSKSILRVQRAIRRWHKQMDSLYKVKSK